MPDDIDDTLADSKDTVTGKVTQPPGSSERPGTEAEEASTGGKAPPKRGQGGTPAGQRNPAFGGEREGADHDTEEAASYRENDA